MSFQKDHVILVNERDEWVGTMEKLAAHREGLLHRAFSVFVLNDKNELLLQQRAIGKYHSGGLWSNTCCSHPRPGESTMKAAHRRLEEEMGFDCELHPMFYLRYRAAVGDDLIENEYDYIYFGTHNGEISANTDEVAHTRYMSLVKLQEWMTKEPQLFTPWFHIALPKFLESLKKIQQPA